MILIGQNNRETAQRISKLLKCKCGKDIPQNPGFIINYGGKCKSAHLNPRIYFNKYRAHRMLEKNNVPVPKLFRYIKDVPKECFPVMARKRYHARGEDIVFINTPEEAKTVKYNFLVQFIKSLREYRVHVFGDEIVSISKKTKRKNFENPSDTIRCFHKGWTQKEYHGLLRGKLKKLAISAKNALKYDFGAVDILQGVDKKLYVLEINSGPRLNKKRRLLYAEAFKKKDAEWQSHQAK